MPQTQLTDVITAKSERAKARVESGKSTVEGDNLPGSLFDDHVDDPLVDPLTMGGGFGPWDGPKQLRHLNETPKPGAFTKKGTETGEAFRLRMKGEMDTLRSTMNTHDTAKLGERDQTVMHQLPESFLEQQEIERFNELRKLGKGKHVTKDTVKGKTPVERYKPSTRTNAPVKDRHGKAIKTPTLSGGAPGALEALLQNPTSSPGCVESPYGTDTSPMPVDRPRTGYVQRHKDILHAATESDRVMRQLDGTGELPTDYHSKNFVSSLPNWQKGYDTAPSGLTAPNHNIKRLKTKTHGPHNNQWGRTRIVGMDRYQNRPTRGGVLNAYGDDAPERLLPELQPSGMSGSTLQNDWYKAKTNEWGESDLDYVAPDSGFNANTGRTGSRLMFTKGNSRETSGKTVDYKYHVTTDHYESSVPISPVESNYRGSHPYAQHTGPKSSLKKHDEKISGYRNDPSKIKLEDKEPALTALHEGRIDERKKEIEALGGQGLVKGVVKNQNRRAANNAFVAGRGPGRLQEALDLTSGVGAKGKASTWDQGAPSNSVPDTSMRDDRLSEVLSSTSGVDVGGQVSGWDQGAPSNSVPDTSMRDGRMSEMVSSTSGVDVGQKTTSYTPPGPTGRVDPGTKQVPSSSIQSDTSNVNVPDLVGAWNRRG